MLVCYIRHMKLYEYKLVATCVEEDAPEIKGDSAEKIYNYMRNAFGEFPEQEQIFVIFLNRKNVIKGRQRLTIGTQTAALLDCPTVFRAALMANATAIIVSHNHPSGDPAPSAPDLHVTRLLREGAKAVQIELLDHVIVGDFNSDPMKKGFYSFREYGLL